MYHIQANISVSDFLNFLQESSFSKKKGHVFMKIMDKGSCFNECTKVQSPCQIT